MIESYIKAGKIVSEVRETALKEVEEGMKVIDLVNFIEENIKNLGAFPAFPCNVSINEVTAHYTSPTNDETTLKAGDMVKIDLGAHVDGYIADSAATILVESKDNDYTKSILPYTPEKQDEMIETVQEALGVAISCIRHGVEVGKIGAEVEELVKSRGFSPVSNLTGHSMDRWILHSGVSIPNVKENNKHKIQEGDVLAIEPFVTDGIGLVSDMKDAFIFRYLRDRPLRMVHARKLLERIRSEYKILPFAQRWLEDDSSSKKIKIAMRQLISSRAIYPYHVLGEKSGARVAQAEHTVIVEQDGCIIITE